MLKLFGKKDKKLTVDLSTVNELKENDKILIDSDGKMKKAAASLIGGGSDNGGAASPFIVRISMFRDQETYEERYEVDHTPEEIHQAYFSGRPVLFGFHQGEMHNDEPISWGVISDIDPYNVGSYNARMLAFDCYNLKLKTYSFGRYAGFRDDNEYIVDMHISVINAELTDY